MIIYLQAEINLITRKKNHYTHDPITLNKGKNWKFSIKKKWINSSVYKSFIIFWILINYIITQSFRNMGVFIINRSRIEIKYVWPLINKILKNVYRQIRLFLVNSTTINFFFFISVSLDGRSCPYVGIIINHLIISIVYYYYNVLGSNIWIPTWVLMSCITYLLDDKCKIAY